MKRKASVHTARDDSPDSPGRDSRKHLAFDAANGDGFLAWGVGAVIFQDCGGAVRDCFGWCANNEHGVALFDVARIELLFADVIGHFTCFVTDVSLRDTVK